MVEIVPANEYEFDLDGFDSSAMTKPYRDFAEKEGIPIHGGIYVPDLNELETGDWDRTGQRGALVNLFGMEGIDDLQIHELEPGGETTEQYHFYHEVVYVLQGRGLTRIGHGGHQHQFEWSKHAVFAIPRNTPYTHINLSDDTAAKLVSQTDLPHLMDVIRDEDFVFNCEYDFWSKLHEDDAYSADGSVGTMYEEWYEEGNAPITWEANFIPDVSNFDRFDVESWNNLGAMKVVRVPFPILNQIDRVEKPTPYMHISQIPVGRYKNAHRHSPGANVFIHSGEGYTLLWDHDLEAEDKKLKADWGPRSVITPPADWWHHHFNLSDEPAGQFAIHAPPLGMMDARGHVFDPFTPKNLIEYVDEEVSTRELYKAELEKRGIEYRMPDESFTDPDYEF